MSSYKSSFNSPRSSPFRRPASPNSPTAVNPRASTPPSRNGASPMTSPSKLKQSYTVSEEEEDEAEQDHILQTPTKITSEHPVLMRAQTEPPPSPTSRMSSNMSKQTQNRYAPTTLTQNDNLSKIPPQLLHSLRESFSVLDSNSSGTINAASVADTLQSLGLQENNMSQFFPPGQPQQLSLPHYLNQLANLLVGLSPQQELLNAFSAFDDDDSGQVDVAELRTALLNTAPDLGERKLNERDIDKAIGGFTGRRILGKNTAGISGVRGLGTPVPKRGGDVFRYQEFVGNLTGGPSIESGQGQSHMTIAR